MNFYFHPEAETEFLDAIDYYESCRIGLGEEFADEIIAAINNIIEFPIIWPLFANNIRRRLIRRFPYSILYSINNNEIYILAIMHLHREPNYWINRLIN